MESQKNLFLIIFFSLLASFPAIASDWVQLYSDEEFTAYVDKQSIKGDMNSRKFWERMVLKERKMDTATGKYYNMIQEYAEIDCNNNIKKFHEIHYYSDGKNIAHSSYSTLPSIGIDPDSAGESVEKYVCSFKPTKKRR